MTLQAPQPQRQRFEPQRHARAAAQARDFAYQKSMFPVRRESIDTLLLGQHRGSNACWPAPFRSTTRFDS
ncbi:TPA: hypothetical protein U2Q23_006138 [Burkholderia multivorans]|uniref:hypothetical protein n=1 Tax=Burkholderia multivorans TaxID=87883 RepID=UPI000757CEBB|nr:hypothetical protein [Burkholderia multivorans]KWF65922.1 hypothetical protein WL91_01110 [Burkholderia multivorans]KWF80529.1 hypothetical protein WL92_09895 [Burkholderia multivorans]MBU9125215.1 hypothetical protein [Burkholderia multivorans]MBU9376797.1 hypothetical protein [Burkholderia multivorans]MBU9435964.1 hypothetical protein [Burkholderia multivorans]